MPASSIVNFAITGCLPQVEYAKECVRKGSTVVGVRGQNFIVMGIERRAAVATLQVDQAIPRIVALNHQMMMSFAGLTMDARKVIQRIQVECQLFKTNTALPANVLHITRFTSQIKQRCTQLIGHRPLATSSLIGGFDTKNTARLYRIDPGGEYFEYSAVGIGRSGSSVMDYFEQNYTAEKVLTVAGAIKLAVGGLLTVLQENSKDFEMAVLELGKPFEVLKPEAITKYISDIEYGI